MYQNRGLIRDEKIVKHLVLVINFLYENMPDKGDEEKQEQKAKIQSESNGDKPHIELQKYFSRERSSDLSSECSKFSPAQSNAKDITESPPIHLLLFINMYIYTWWLYGSFNQNSSDLGSWKDFLSAIWLCTSSSK